MAFGPKQSNLLAASNLSVESRNEHQMQTLHALISEVQRNTLHTLNYRTTGSTSIRKNSSHRAQLATKNMASLCRKRPEGRTLRLAAKASSNQRRLAPLDTKLRQLQSKMLRTANQNVNHSNRPSPPKGNLKGPEQKKIEARPMQEYVTVCSTRPLSGSRSHQESKFKAIGSQKMSVLARYTSQVEGTQRQSCPKINEAAKRSQQMIRTSSSALGFAQRKSSAIETAKR